MMTELLDNHHGEMDAYVAALQWHVDNDAYFLFEEFPVDKCSIKIKPKSLLQTIPDTIVLKNNNVSTQDDNQAIGSAETISRLNSQISSIDNIADFKDFIMKYDGIALKKTAMNTIFSTGNVDAKLMIIGECPDSSDDKSGKIFSGEAGLLLDAMLGAINISRDDAYITNVSFWRPPGNRSLSDSEQDIFKILVKKHIDLIKPDILFLMGKVSAKQILDVDGSISRIRDKMYKYNDVDCIVTYHPDNLMTNCGYKKKAWADLLRLKSVL